MPPKWDTSPTLLRRIVSLRETLWGQLLVLAPVVDEELGHDAGPEIVSSAQGLVVHLRWWDRHREVVLVQRCRRGRVQQRVDVTNRLVRAGPLLEVDARRVRDWRMYHGRRHCGCLGKMLSQGRRVEVTEISRAVVLDGGAEVDRGVSRIAGRCHGDTCRHWESRLLNQGSG